MFGFESGAWQAPAILVVAFAVDLMVGDESILIRRTGHPVAHLGRLIGYLEARLNRSPGAWVSGAALAAGFVIAAGALGWLLAAMARLVPGGWLAEALILGVLLAARGLYEHVRAVRRLLIKGRDGAARRAVARIVGRDPAGLDRSAIARAAIESLSENFSDGVVAPLLWYLVAGLPGLFAYKTINTLDSMIGHRTQRYHAFGWASARLDDLANFVPARVSGVLFVMVAGRSAPLAALTMLRDAGTHLSPNAGLPEAAMAGAVGGALGGPRSYGGRQLAAAWLGAGLAPADMLHMGPALALYLRATGALFLAAATLAYLTGAGAPAPSL